MKDRIHISGPTTPAIEQHVEDRLTAALGQHDRHVEKIDVKLQDLNGPKGGVDQQCRVIVTLHKAGELIVDERGEDLYATISVAADRLKQAAGRKLGKLTDHRAPAAR